MKSGKQQDEIGTAFHLGCYTSTAVSLKQGNHLWEMDNKCNMHSNFSKYVLCDPVYLTGLDVHGKFRLRLTRMEKNRMYTQARRLCIYTPDYRNKKII